MNFIFSTIFVTNFLVDIFYNELFLDDFLFCFVFKKVKLPAYSSTEHRSSHIGHQIRVVQQAESSCDVTSATSVTSSNINVVNDVKIDNLQGLI